MDATATALARIASQLEPGALSPWLDAAQLLAAIASVVALFVAASALSAERKARSSDSLARLLDYFDAAGYFLRMWRLEQSSRGEAGPASTSPVELRSLTRNSKPVVASLAADAFATDWEGQRADMYGVYFFALRTHAWLGRRPRWRKDRRARQLNDAFGHQLLGTVLNHGLVACRVKNPSVPADYYPTHYGLFDGDYADLVDRLAADLLEDGRLNPPVQQPMTSKLAALRAHKKTLAPISSAADLAGDSSG